MRASRIRRSRWGALACLALAVFACESKPLDPGDAAPSAPFDMACSAKRYTCIDRSVITIWWVCDGVPDCLQGEDEEGCPNKCPVPALDDLGPTEDGDCAGTGEKFVECGLLDSPLIAACWDDYQAAQCQLGCYEEASCGELLDNLCTPIATPSLDRCLNECSAMPFFCENEARIPSNWECDGEADCPSGEDEVGCPSFTCATGQAIDPGWVCDDFPDCPGGEDELGCSPILCPQFQ